MLTRLLLLSLFFLPGLNHRATPSSRPISGTRQMDVVRTASGIAAAHPRTALRDLARHGIASSLGMDGRTIEVQLGSRQIAILPPFARSAPVAMPFVPSIQTGGRAAAVLEPFATELGLGVDAGSPEATVLQQAGFTVTILRDSQVTVQAMADLTADSVIYIETHAGRLTDGDAVVATGQTDTTGLAALFKDGSVIQVFVAGDPTKTLYVGVTGTFFADHTAPFPAHSLLFLNGCSVLGDARFWADLDAHNLATLISWDDQASDVTEAGAATVVLEAMGGGATVVAALATAHAAGVDVSAAGGQTAHLGFRGDGTTTLNPPLAPSPTYDACRARPWWIACPDHTPGGGNSR